MMPHTIAMRRFASSRWLSRSSFALALGSTLSCAGAVGDANSPYDGPVAEDVDCTTFTDTGYNSGKAFAVTLVTVNEKPISVSTAHAFIRMRAAAEEDGVKLRLNSGFRTMSEQQYLYRCYQTKSCNNGNLAAKPGYSNHQNALAVDVSDPSGKWLYANAKRFGFENTVPSEPWHWEYAGKDPGGMCSR